MKLKLTSSLKTRLTQFLTGVLFDLIDGGLDAATETAKGLRSLADEIDKQNNV
jgi:hypothetical protein